ncbi:unnamed protein product [Rotaria magnacalcarata]|uniref:RRM domain-containing protein n=1 Tax=Rotaria magnacalcarata TaxID=392030 RepID=A0A819NVE7_9BILA|nr:unnamed protein product [Rotaria magnacalcarata]CAF1472841.1 unnamed protein product [Rotaria magnacalcarata]CAF2029405.1 unnamed protein product [Rotaria magnacalcarata]CAF2099271.1 unnamed protein product [Rotaria magnacalcarata]CAF2201787.1 unnamed protein product [Rotaria magnacalcarata]
MGDRQLFLGNLCTVTVETLRTYCEKYGTIIDLTLNRDKDNNIYHCFAFVTFQSSCSITQFMSARPHLINDEEIFVKRALPRLTASIPERLVVTNRLLLSKSTNYDKESLRNYFNKLGSIKKFHYEKGLIDYKDYDDVDKILLTRPHYIEGKEIFVTKFIPNEHQDHEIVNQQPDRSLLKNEEKSLKIKYKYLEKQFEEYKQIKDKEINALKKELQNIKEELSDITQVKLDRLIRNQQLFHRQLLLCLNPNSNLIHAQMCDDFLRSAPYKKRKTTTSLIDNQSQY